MGLALCGGGGGGGEVIIFGQERVVSYLGGLQGMQGTLQNICIKMKN